MKKPKLMALALTAAITLSGVGYAYWTDAVTIKNTVTTGTFQVDVETPIVTAVEDGSNTIYATATASETSRNTIKFKVKNMYPGATAKLEAKVKNNGTIPVVFEGAVVNFTSDVAGLKDDLQGLLGYMKYDKNGKLTGWNWQWVHRLNGIEGNLETLFDGLRLEEGEYITLDIPYGQGTVTEDILKLAEEEKFNITPDDNCFNIIMGTWITELQDVENKSMAFDMTINWKQHNVK